MSRTRTCPHCGEQHPIETLACPKTKKPMERGASGLPKLRFAMERLDDDDTKQGEPKPSIRRPVLTGPNALVGETIDGKYLIKSVLGAGGMGTVYAAENIRLGRPVAIKVLVKNSADPSGEKRFSKEARATGSISHPHICQVYDFGITNGSPYIVMEKLVGETLSTRIARERILPIDEACSIIADVADGLGAAHAQNILHRDVKPDNVFLAKIGDEIVVKLVDFGIAKNIRKSGTMDTLTQVGTIVGTPDYMAPEQAAGARDLDARVDVYACGVMLYELLTGTRPFVASDTRELLQRVLAGAPTPPRTHRPEISRDLEQVVLVAMRKNPRDRFDSARELSNALRQIARSGSTSISIPAQASPALPSELATKASRAPALDAMRTIEDPRKPGDDD
jgi:serine/threonine-protein kinase